MSTLVDIKYGTTIVATTCGVCHIPFGLPEQLYDKARTDGTWFWCPNGHQIHWSQTENQKLKKQVEHLESDKKWLQRAKDSAAAEAEHQRSRANGYKGALTKTKKRIGKGVCPCCNRHFANVERHMATQHPEIAAPDEGA